MFKYKCGMENKSESRRMYRAFDSNILHICKNAPIFIKTQEYFTSSLIITLTRVIAFFFFLLKAKFVRSSIMMKFQK